MNEFEQRQIKTARDEFSADFAAGFRYNEWAHCLPKRWYALVPRRPLSPAFSPTGCRSNLLATYRAKPADI
ncbi:MAG: hypothetical protein WAN51_04200 [Alphaproteobacteria bacterium]